MDRRERALQHIDRTRPGVEIGPSHSPTAPKREGFSVHIIDHMSREELRAKYRAHPVNLENIEVVDFIWTGQRFAELTGMRKHYHWIIASHVIEHTPDLIGFLKDCDDILCDDGVISLVIPDKRACFDYYRPLTGLARIIDSHVQQHTIHSAGTVAEYFLNVVASHQRIVWGLGPPIGLDFVHKLEDARTAMDTVMNHRTYLDVHSWCFTPNSFRLIIHDLHSLGLIPFQEVDFTPTIGHEFFVTLGRSGRGVNVCRLRLLELIQEELQEAALSNHAGSPASAGVRRFSLARLMRWVKRLRAG